uniref:Prenyl transferase n=1 Tax=Anotrichium furcellatum TaxID=41999 RepID=A0A4D6WL47_9FLOR|nr:Prenyl transferase [Anotrichium furcellatum]
MSSYQNPFSEIEEDLCKLKINLKSMIAAKNPVLYAAAEHLFNASGKQIRPSIILTIAKYITKKNQIFPEHRRLAEITEIIHTASLVHDDIIDECDTRRGVDTVHNIFSNKIAILAGDFLFAKSSWYLANLNDVSVVQTISKVITDFAEGEVRQGLTNFNTTLSIDDYIEKSFYKTASLIASSCQGTAMLSKCNRNIVNKIYLYGKHIGLAFQIIDDILDITTPTNTLGKPQGSDLKNGNLTAPIMFTLIENPAITSLVHEEFTNVNNINDIIYSIKDTKSIQKAKDLANEHLQIAADIIQNLKLTNSKTNIFLISNYILNRIN